MTLIVRFLVRLLRFWRAFSKYIYAFKLNLVLTSLRALDSEGCISWKRKGFIGTEKPDRYIEVFLVKSQLSQESKIL